jgi:hypothetical protein
MNDLEHLIFDALEGNAVEFQKGISDELHARAAAAVEQLRPQIAASMFGEEVELDEISSELKSRYAKKAQSSLKRATAYKDKAKKDLDTTNKRIDYAYRDHDNWIDSERASRIDVDKEMKKNDRASEKIAKHSKTIAKRTAGLKRANEEYENVQEVELDEISSELKSRYAKKAQSSLNRATKAKGKAEDDHEDAEGRIRSATNIAYGSHFDPHAGPYWNYIRKINIDKEAKRSDRAYDRIAKHDKTIAKRTAGLKRANEEYENVQEVAQPKSPSDKVATNIPVSKKEHPVANEVQFTAKNEKDKSKKASYHAGEDEAAYQAAQNVGIAAPKE